MGGKSDLNTRIDRPETGGAERTDLHTNPGLQDRETQKLAQDMAAKRANAPEQAGEASHDAFSVGHEPAPTDRPAK